MNKIKYKMLMNQIGFYAMLILASTVDNNYISYAFFIYAVYYALKIRNLEKKHDSEL